MKSTSPHIIIENGAIKKIPQKVKNLGKVFTIITDGNLKKMGEELFSRMRTAGMKSNLLIVPAGEKTKSLTMVEKLAQSLLKFGLKRDACLIGFGGGVIGDVTGFLASIYMRGIRYVSVPTTLLAMGDSSLGGKTGVDLAEGKNLLGSFYNPSLIIMDPLLLASLPERDFRCGMAEIVKHGIIADKTFFAFLEKNVAGILQRKPAILKKIVEASVRIKMNIVRRDPTESLDVAKRGTKGSISRMLVNYGHTVGHALEKLSGYTLLHGEAIAIGMVAENRIAVEHNSLPEKDAARIQALLKAFHLPTKIPVQYDSATIKKALGMDKKHIDGKLYFALPAKIGMAKIVSV